MFRVGQKVVCVDDDTDRPYGFRPLKKGAVYTVMAVNVCSCGNIRIDIGVRMAIHTRCAICSNRILTPEWWFRSERFRPVIDLLDEQLDDIENTSIEELEEELYQTL